MLSLKKKPKVFVIGFNKTGTTSLKVALKYFGYKIGNQRTGEKLIDEYLKRNFKPIIKLAKSAEAFQDIPFSLPYTYIVLDHYFPKSKFILTIRDNPEQWYQSITRFHSKFLNLSSVPPKTQDLQKSNYVDKGWLWKAQQALFQVDENAPYNKDKLISTYKNHNRNVIDYFAEKPNLLVLNLKDDTAMESLKTFLGVRSDLKEIPWENKT